jgi:hypothetical protein
MNNFLFPFWQKASDILSQRFPSLIFLLLSF